MLVGSTPRRERQVRPQKDKEEHCDAFKDLKLRQPGRIISKDDGYIFGNVFILNLSAGKQFSK